MAATNKQRIQLKVIDVDTNEERVTGDIVVVRGFCTYCCTSCTVLADGGPVLQAQTKQ